MSNSPPVSLYLSDLAPSGRPAMRSALHVIARIVEPSWDSQRELDAFPWRDLRRPQTQEIRAAIVRQYAPRTANRMLSALRQVLRRCWQDGSISRDEYALATDIKPAPVHEESPGRALAVAEVERLIFVARSAPGARGLRDAAIVAALYGAGLRRVEAARARTGDYDMSTHEIRVTGKGSKVRTVPLIPGWEADLEVWLSQIELGPMFPRIRTTCEITQMSMTADDVGLVMRELGARAGVEAAFVADKD